MSEAPDPKDAPDINPVIKEMHSQNDRGAAICGSAFLDEKLSEAIERRWPPISRTMQTRLFTGYGPLASFSGKIDIACAMGVLHPQTKADCHKVRAIRNAAAHLGMPFSFDDPEIRGHLDNIECITHFPLDTLSDQKTRNQFTSAIKMLCAYLFFQEVWKRRFGFNAVMPPYSQKHKEA